MPRRHRFAKFPQSQQLTKLDFEGSLVVNAKAGSDCCVFTQIMYPDTNLSFYTYTDCKI